MTYVENEEKVFLQISKVGIMAISAMADAEEDRSFTVSWAGKLWRITIEEIAAHCCLFGGNDNAKGSIGTTGKKRRGCKKVAPLVVGLFSVLL